MELNKMRKGKINPDIIKWIKKKAKNKKNISEFLLDLVYEEADHTGHWWWKETYKKKLEEHSKDWEKNNEN